METHNTSIGAKIALPATPTRLVTAERPGTPSAEAKTKSPSSSPSASSAASSSSTSDGRPRELKPSLSLLRLVRSFGHLVGLGRRSPGLYSSATEIRAALAAADAPPLVFLDVDGVLVREGEQIFHGPCVDELERVLRATGARVVLSSAWREFHGMATKVDDLLRDRRLPPLLSATPSLLTTGRRGEIKRWLKKHAPTSAPRFVAVDDRFLDLGPHFVHTLPYVGLGPADADRAIAALNRGPACDCAVCRRGPSPASVCRTVSL